MKLFRRVLLPALLLLAVGWGLGGYSETNDDAAIMLLLRGTMAAAPVTDLHLYFHGLSALLVWLYEVAPAVSWYPVLLYALLYAATVGAFTILDRLLADRVPAIWATALLLLFFLTAWLEHGLWFNYVRVPILLAGVGVLLAAQRPASRLALLLGVLAFGLGWLIRPSAALLGLLAAAPGALWLSGRRALPILAATVLWAGLGGSILVFTRTAPAAAYRTLDVLKSNLNDYQLYRLTPRTATDSLGLAAVRHWQLADSTLVNPILFQRALTPDIAYFLRHTAVSKLHGLLQMLVRDYFPLLLLQAVLLGWLLITPSHQRHRSFWLGQVAYVGLVLALGLVLKLPPRVALPLLDLWVLSNLLYVLPSVASGVASRRLVAALLAVLALAAVPYSYKTLHRRQVLRTEQQRNEMQQPLLMASAGQLVVTDVLPYKSANAFRTPALRPASVLLLAGWTSADPSQAAFRQQLTGTRYFPESLRRLAQRPTMAWVLTPAGAAILNRQLARLSGLRLQLVPVGPPVGAGAEVAQRYQPRPQTRN